MEALSAFIATKRDFVQEKTDAGRLPTPPQLVLFLQKMCEEMRPLVSANGVPGAFAVRLRKGFHTIGWDVGRNKPDPARKTPPTTPEILAFLTKAAALEADTPPQPAAPASAASAQVRAKAMPAAGKVQGHGGGGSGDRPAPLDLELAAAQPGEGEVIFFGAPSPSANTAQQTSAASRAAREGKMARSRSEGGTPSGHGRGGQVGGGTRNAQFRLRVENVPPHLTATELKALFVELGALDAEIANKGTTGFVSFSSQAQLDEAAGATVVAPEAPGSEECTHQLSLSVAAPKGERRSGSAGRSRGKSPGSDARRGGGGRGGERDGAGDWRTPQGGGGRSMHGPPQPLRQMPDKNDWRSGPRGGRDSTTPKGGLERAKSVGAPTTRWDAPPSDKWSEEKGWQEVKSQSAKGSKTPRGLGGGGRTRRGGRTPRGGGRGGGGRGGGRGRGNERQQKEAAQREEWKKYGNFHLCLTHFIYLLSSKSFLTQLRSVHLLPVRMQSTEDGCG
jgi:hypothetical protein